MITQTSMIEIRLSYIKKIFLTFISSTVSFFQININSKFIPVNLEIFQLVKVSFTKVSPFKAYVFCIYLEIMR